MKPNCYRMPNSTEIVTIGPQVAEWIEDNCVHTKGRWREQPFHLTDWERDCLNEMYEVIPLTDEDGEQVLDEYGEVIWIRKYRRGLLGIPKKNGKTEFAAAIACYEAVGTREIDPEVHVASNSEEQANLVFGAVKAMFQLSPTLSQISHPWASHIDIPENGGEIVRNSSRAKTRDGLNASMVIFDEFHEFDDAGGLQLYNVLSNAIAARMEPFVLCITTAGWDEDTPCGRMYNHGINVVTGKVHDPGFWFRWYFAPEHLDIHLPSTWRIANPSYGVTVLPRFYEDQLTSEKNEAQFRRYFLNQWTSVETLWLDLNEWELCRDPSVEVAPGSRIILGWDAGRSRDSTAIVFAARAGSRVAFRARVWDRPSIPATGKPDETWKVPVGEVMNYIRELARTYRVEAIGYDPWGLRESIEQLETEGFNCVEVPQTNARMIPATEYLEELIKDGVLAHAGDVAYTRHMANVIARETSNGIRMTKNRARRPMDAGTASAICAYLLKDMEPEAKRSVYETRGLAAV